MSRLVGIGFILCDATATILSLLNSSGILIITAISLVTSIALAVTSSVVRATFWPTYFWDDPDGLKLPRS